MNTTFTHGTVVLAAALLLCGATPLSAQARYPRESLSVRLERIRKDKKVNIVADEKQVGAIGMVPAVPASGRDAAGVLSATLAGTGMKVTRTGASFVVSRGAAPVAARPVKPSQGRHGTLKGTVLDTNNQPVIGATIVVGGTSLGTASDVNGAFTIAGVPAGSFTVEVSCMSYAKMKVSDVKIQSGRTTPLNVVLEEDAHQLQGVTVTATYNKASATGLYAKQKSMVAMSDGISADMIKKTSDSNVAQVLRRVSGVTIEGGKFINVRGMGERYNNVELNGTTLPSTEPNRRNFAFDIIPSNLVDNVTISKTFTPDMQGEFTGGMVNVSTLSIPHSQVLSFSVGTGFNTVSTGKAFYGARRLGGDYFLGNNKERNWFGRDWVNDTYNGYINNDLKKANEMNARIPNHWGMRKYTGAPTQNYAFTFGRPFTLKNGDRLGFILSATYRHEENASNMFPSKFRKYEEYLLQGDSYKFATAVGAIVNIGYEHGNHKVTWSNLFNNRFTQSNMMRVTFDDSGGNQYLEQYSSPMRNVLWQTRLEGSHRFGGDVWTLTWFADFNQTSRGQHDDRYMRGGIKGYTQGMAYEDMMVEWEPTNGKTAFDLGMGHIMYNNLKETKKNIGLNLSRAFVLMGNKQVLKAGYWFTFRRADYSQQYLTPLYGYGVSDAHTEGQLVEQVYSSDNFKNGTFTYKFGGQYGPTIDYYKGRQNLHAAYLMGDFSFFKKLHVTGGVRMEKSNMSSRSYFLDRKTALPKDSTVAVDKTDFLPAITLVYNFTPNINLRAAYGKTLARPDFRELTRYSYYNVADRMDMGGFPLENSYVHNYDVRAEWYPEAGEVLSLGFFYKKFKKPIEVITYMTSAGNYTGIVFNLEGATAKGLEFNMRKSFGFLAPTSFLKDLYLTGNVTWLSGNVSYNLDRLVANANGLGGSVGNDAFKDSNRKRPLLGMAPFIVNAGLTYTGSWYGASLNFGTTGRRIVTAGADEASDEYENSRALLDLQLSVKPLKNLEVKFNAGDILHQSALVYINRPRSGSEQALFDQAKPKRYQKGLDVVRSHYKTGTTYSLSVSYQF